MALMSGSRQVATGFYQHLGFRLMAMIRGGLISLIYRKGLQLPSSGASDSPVMTLIATDVERICEIWHLMILEVVPGSIQLGIAVWLLQRQLGAVCVAPVILVFCKFANRPSLRLSDIRHSGHRCHPQNCHVRHGSTKIMV